MQDDPLQRILNVDELVSHGNVGLRRAAIEILEAGMRASDPYPNTRRLVRVDGNLLRVGGAEFEPAGCPRRGEEAYDLSSVDRIFVFGAGKGIQRVAKALEDSLGDRLTGGCVIDKKGHPVILQRIEVVLGAHPVPDNDCVAGCLRIRELAADLTERDLVFTCVGNGVSALLTLPVPGVDIEDIRKTTYIMQVERGAGTGDLNTIRNNLDMMKSGRISRLFSKCRTVHILALEPGEYDQLMHNNLWLHTLPDDHTSYRLAVETLHRWRAWESVPESVRAFLARADENFAPMRSAEFERMPSRIFGVMPGFHHTAKLPPAVARARELGFETMVLADDAMGVEASQEGKFLAAMARNVERAGQPCNAPCAIFSAGEMVVTVGEERGIGGRNQEMVLSAALGIAGMRSAVVASVDTDGTDGPGVQFSEGAEGMPKCFAGGLVDEQTLGEAQRLGIDVAAALRHHDTSPALWKLKSAILATPNISLNDLTVVLVNGQR